MKRITKLLSVMILIFCSVVFVQKVNAAETTKTQSPWATSSEGSGSYYGLYGYYINQSKEALAKLNEIRYEACKEGVPDPRNSSRKLTLSDYVPLKWSTELERVARDRAAEAAVSIAHERLNGASIWTLSYNSVRSYAEDLAWNFATDMLSGISQFYDEKDDWINACAGKEHGITGHYTSIINPKYTYVGVGDFYSTNTKYRNSLALELTMGSQTLSTTMLSGTSYIYQKIQVASSNVGTAELSIADAVYKGKTTTAMPYVKINNAKLIPIGTYTYKSANTSIATVTNDGVITGAALGTTTISMYLNGSKYCSTSVTVACSHSYKWGNVDSNGQRKGTCSVCGASKTINVPTSYKLYWRADNSTSSYWYSSFPAYVPVGTTIRGWLSEIDGDSGYNELEITSSNSSVLAVSSSTFSTSKNAELVVKSSGVVTITIQAKYNPNLKKVLTVTVGAAGSVNIKDVATTIPTTFAGKAETVKLTYKGYTLVQNSDYTITVAKQTDDYKITLTGKGLFTGTITKTISKDFQYATTLSSVKNVEKGMEIKWSSVSGVTKYQVFRRTVGNGWVTGWKWIKDTTGLSVVDTTAENGKTYEYVVKTLFDTRKGVLSEGKIYKRIEAPKNLSCVAVTNGIKTTWSKVTGATKYQVFRKTIGNGWETGWTWLKDTTSTTFTDTKAEKSKTYVYAVKAFVGDYQGCCGLSAKIKR